MTSTLRQSLRRSANPCSEPAARGRLSRRGSVDDYDDYYLRVRKKQLLALSAAAVIVATEGVDRHRQGAGVPAACANSVSGERH